MILTPRLASFRFSGVAAAQAVGWPSKRCRQQNGVLSGVGDIYSILLRYRNCSPAKPKHSFYTEAPVPEGISSLVCLFSDHCAYVAVFFNMAKSACQPVYLTRGKRNERSSSSRMKTRSSTGMTSNGAIGNSSYYMTYCP